MERSSYPAIGLLLLTLCALLAACGEKLPTSPSETGVLPPETRPLEPLPPDPEAALALIRQVSARGGALRRRLQSWPIEEEAFSFTTETQIALTWRLRLALEDLRVDDAARDFGFLVRDFEGEGESPEGATLSRRTMELGLFEGALRAARAAMHGVPPMRQEAVSLLTRAEDWLAPTDKADRKRLAGQRSWLLAEQAEEIYALAGLDTQTRGTLSDVQVLVFVDEFALGQFPFTTVLERWQREGARVLAIPLLRRQVRVGQRLMPAESEAHERDSLESHAKEVGLPLLSPAAIPSERLESLGFGPQEILLLIYDDRGRILARVAGIGPDLRVYDPVIQRLLTR